MKKNGFTLAEVLITLGIIGIVAALTLPFLLPKIEKMKTEARLAKFYSTIQGALNTSTAKHGNPREWDYSSAKTVYDNYFKGVLAAREPYYQHDNSVYIKLHDGTCAVLRFNNGYGAYMKNYYWGINLNCGAFPQQEGLTVFELSLFNFLKPGSSCHYTPTGCGWPGDLNYDPYYADRFVKATCTIHSNYAWKAYDCYLKIVQNGFKISDDYKYYQQPREGRALPPDIHYWNKIK